MVCFNATVQIITFYFQPTDRKVTGTGQRGRVGIRKDRRHIYFVDISTVAIIDINYTTNERNAILE